MLPLKPLSTSGAVILLVVGGVSIALAQAAGMGPQASPMYDVKTETTSRGVVERVEVVTGMHGRGQHARGSTHLVLRTDKEAIEVHVGPAAFLSENGITLAKGDMLEIRGSRVTVSEKPVVIAKEIMKGDATWTRRDASGRPLWRGPRR